MKQLHQNIIGWTRTLFPENFIPSPNISRLNSRIETIYFFVISKASFTRGTIEINLTENLKTPGIQLDNITSKEKRLRIDSYGRVYLETEISAKFSCSMPHKNFPDVKVKNFENGGICFSF